MHFEIQVKTLLDNVWSEIEHDRNYKISKEFPEDSHIPRSFNLLAGLLEIADNEFDYLSKETSQYDKSLKGQIERGELDNIQISLHALRLYLEKQFRDIPDFKSYFQIINQILDELCSMEIK